MNKKYYIVLTNECGRVLLDSFTERDNAVYVLRWYNAHAGFFNGVFSIEYE